MNTGTQILNFAFTEDYGGCTPFTYSSSLSSGTSLPAFITFNAVLE